MQDRAAVITLAQEQTDRSKEQKRVQTHIREQMKIKYMIK